MLLPVGAYVQIIANKFYEDGIISSLRIPAYLISRFSINGKLAYFFKPHDFVGHVRAILVWRERLPIIGSGEYNYLPKGWKKKSENELKLQKPYYLSVSQTPHRLILNNFRRNELIDIVTFYRMEIKIGERTKNNEVLEQIQRHFTFIGTEKRNIKSLSCEPQEGIILIDDRILDIESINKRPCWMYVNKNGAIERDSSVGLEEEIGYFFRKFGTMIDKEGKRIEESEDSDDAKEAVPANPKLVTASSGFFAPPKRPRRGSPDMSDRIVHTPEGYRVENNYIVETPREDEIVETPREDERYAVRTEDGFISHFINNPSFTFEVERANITPSEDEEDEEARGEE